MFKIIFLILILINQNKMTEDYKKSYDFLYKIVLIGNSGVGKSNLLLRFARDEFELETKSTIGVEFRSVDVEIDDKIIKAQIWDTAGQERYRAITSAYYRGASGAILVFDITKADTFIQISRWYEELREHTENIPIILIGNKFDLSDDRQVPIDLALEYTSKNKILFAETSALTSHNVHDAFTQIIKEIHYASTKKKQEEEEEEEDPNVTIIEIEPKSKVDKCIC
jgi:small GTP-binding protein